MSEIDPITGLPKELGVWENITKQDQKIEVKVVKRRFGKLATVVTGFDKSMNVKELAKKLKSKLACGGTNKDGVIELQGEHTAKVKKILIDEGFQAESIKIKPFDARPRKRW
ncbi:stress response translation initiation inhibitor YciH [archaeon]|jgi:translation initiation factor 1|nr:stress response translation initiation inhibitor YciH [archaeon]MBT3730911.1 stress response translation initiation inhibitor YciH [archaeon]MBT4669850.1 stress response translation initiation inhibitor YciH [archaeon]MBT5030002.1 stress response translation initiation inhibitor YciH [archaeon]MBT5288103.1 stress response translation initiation inhibitor YciH [archaeon]